LDGDFVRAGGATRALLSIRLALALSMVAVVSCDSTRAPGSFESTANVWLSPTPVVRGRLDVTVQLEPTYLPDSHRWKEVTFQATRESDEHARCSGSAQEDSDRPGTYRFSIDVDAPGDWRIEIEARWQDGHLYSRETILVHDVE
jgi:hypothetical protein